MRNDFNETMLMYTAAEARTEASRCVDCDTICGICVGVCPNLALMTYAPDALSADLPSYSFEAGVLVETGRSMYAVWKGLDGSMPEIPLASQGGTRIPAPAL